MSDIRYQIYEIWDIRYQICDNQEGRRWEEPCHIWWLELHRWEMMGNDYIDSLQMIQVTKPGYWNSPIWWQTIDWNGGKWFVRSDNSIITSKAVLKKFGVFCALLSLTRMFPPKICFKRILIFFLCWMRGFYPKYMLNTFWNWIEMFNISWYNFKDLFCIHGKGYIFL